MLSNKGIGGYSASSGAPFYMLTKSKIFICPAMTIGIFLALLLFDNQITSLLVSLSAAGAPAESGALTTDSHMRYHRIVVNALSGMVLFYLFCSLEYFLSENIGKTTKIVRCGHLALRMLRWVMVLIFGDIVLQNIGGASTTLWNYTMRYQTAGALIAIELMVLRSFFSAHKKEPSTQPLH